MKPLTLIVFLFLLCLPALAAPHHAHHTGPSIAHAYKYKHGAATGDYARGVGLSNDTVLSTGWTGGHGGRQTQVHDYYRHTRGGRLIHVHGYYRH